MNRRPKIGLLPLYLKLYDETMPELRREFQPFLDEIAVQFFEKGVDAIRAEVCRLEPEFHAAVQRFEQEDADLIVALHLAYSPSLESAAALAATPLPILLLDVTMDYSFGPDVDPARIMFNHGIHGVQDLACMLRRKGKPFEIIAGHYRQSNALARAADCARAAFGAKRLRQTKALRIGESFHGMGDFAVADSTLKEILGIMVDEVSPKVLIEEINKIDNDAIDEEMRLDREQFSVEAPEETHRRSVRLGLALRHYLEKNHYTAFSQNFLAFDSNEGPIDTVPFLEASKAMARGVGYAGEGDVLTAALVGALQCAFGKTTFTEIFCPDWKGGSLFLSHMGEINPETAAQKPRLIEKDFPWTGARNPAVITCAPAPGPAVLVNLAPGPQDSFRLILASVEVLGDALNTALRDSIRGWIKPSPPLEHFLEAYSRNGGTHHSALVLGERAEALNTFAAFAGVEVVRIE
ncbi:MAG: hypothetical protein AB1656_27435 [Candidatus Omnitrophota bacterium]